MRRCWLSSLTCGWILPRLSSSSSSRLWLGALPYSSRHSFMLVLLIIKYSRSSVYPVDIATRPLCECSHGEEKRVRRRGDGGWRRPLCRKWRRTFGRRRPREGVGAGVKEELTAGEQRWPLLPLYRGTREEMTNYRKKTSGMWEKMEQIDGEKTELYNFDNWNILFILNLSYYESRGSMRDNKK